MKSKAYRRATAAATLLACSIASSAQVKDVGSAINSVGNTVRGVIGPLADTISFIIGLVGLVLLVPAISKYSKGDHTSADAFLKWAGGILMAYIAIQVIRMIST